MAKILIVDDSAFARKVVGMIVESGGHEVIGRACDGESGLEMFRSLEPELVTLDYMMAGKNGEEVLEEMIEHDPSSRVIMIAGSHDQVVQEKVLQTGAKEFIDKDCVQKDLLNVIDQVMAA